jgi:hypothetical protein
MELRAAARCSQQPIGVVPTVGGTNVAAASGPLDPMMGRKQSAKKRPSGLAQT